MDERWISDKLPEVCSNYIVTVEVNDKLYDDPYRFVCIDHYNGCGHWTNHNRKQDKVVAWMPLPDAYEEYER